MTRRTRAQLQHDLHRVRRENDALRAAWGDRNVLVRIGKALGVLDGYSDPTPAATPLHDGSRGRSDGWDRPPPGVSTARWRSMHRRYMKRLRVLANDLERDVYGVGEGELVTPAPVRDELAAENMRKAK